MTPGAFHPSFEDLPAELPIFPLMGAIVLPWAKLPLNIFEPRYLTMIQDSLGTGRMVGMIQPRKAYRAAGEAPVPLYDVGCAGRVSSFTESPDGRLLITLTGVIRFTISEELPMRRGYRVVRPNWQPFARDLEVPEAFSVNSKKLLVGLAGIVTRSELPMNVRMMQELSPLDLVNTLCMTCPFEVQEKQTLLEASSPAERAKRLEALLQFATYADGSEAQSPQ